MQLNTKKSVVTFIYDAYRKKLYSKLSEHKKMKKYKRHFQLRNFIGYSVWFIILFVSLILIPGMLLACKPLLWFGIILLMIVIVEYSLSMFLKIRETIRFHEEILPYQISALMEVLDSQKIDDIKEIELEEQQSMVVRAFSKLFVTLSTVGVGIVGLISSDNEQINKLIEQATDTFKDAKWFSIIGMAIFILLLVYLVTYFFDFTIHLVKDTPYEKWGEIQEIYTINKYINSEFLLHQEGQILNNSVQEQEETSNDHSQQETSSNSIQ